ncbi:Haloalkane dehalogenase [Trichoplax sp. H2]|uniref:AB hydrolase-1 domain-containing protein n=1 Tax=Trichoplax adhaerens TaxID=10228 RepID=B3S950_TRIAD|nr:expressed hypothetical protein [Trichoplax adhaerens]EDV20737.1 expressed hypothetical protein [Trichoplax adhaerens]RDD37981.1 Haloalkane dehalogenase [Trichoplax sp. H2]|eukprot:XP_002116678.1 expressed hypothetical protein [Trichoplax adhaerens]
MDTKSVCPISTFSTDQSVQHMIKKLKVLNAEIAYVDTGAGNGYPVLFFHGNPTSSYLWRNVIPLVSKQFRCLAPDLVGMGNSSKVTTGYRVIDHHRYIDQWMDQVLPTGKVNIVCHDWGTNIAFNWCRRHPERVNCIVHMEGMVLVGSWKFAKPDFAKTFKALRTPDIGEKMVLEKNMFVEQLLPSSIMRKLSEEEMQCYRQPFVTPGESRQPMLSFPRDIPFVEDGPEDVAEIVNSYIKWLSETPVPKLCILAEPGVFSPNIERATKSWKNQQFATVKGLHFMQEDSPTEIAELVINFLSSESSKM